LDLDRYRPDLPQLALIVANLLPIAGVLFLDWDVGSIVVLYWAENLIVGGYTLLRILIVGRLHSLFFMLFFSVHYGGFCAVHGMFVLELTQFAGAAVTEPTHWPGPLVFVEMFIDLSRRVLAAAPEQFLWACLALLISHGVSFMLLFIGQQEYRNYTTSQLMHAPYRRVAILHIAIITGGFLVRQLDSPIGLLLALVVLKTVMDIMLHNRSHAGAALSQASTDPANKDEGEQT